MPAALAAPIPTGESSNINASLGRTPSFSNTLLYISGLGLPWFTSSPARTSEKEWRQALHKWMDTMVVCPNCKLSFCVTVKNNKIEETVCPHCKKKTKLELPILIIKRNGKVERTIVLEEDKQIAKSSVTSERSNEPALIIRRSKKIHDIFGIENLLSYQWRCSQQGAKDRLIKTNEVVPALNGVHIEFDYVYSGDIIYSRY